MSDLIKRLTEATEGSAELSAEIARDVLNIQIAGLPRWNLAYTTSVDAALGLVPEGAFWSVMTAGDGRGFDAAVTLSGHPDRLNYVRHTTAPMALCIAALKERGL